MVLGSDTEKENKKPHTLKVGNQVLMVTEMVTATRFISYYVPKPLQILNHLRSWQLLGASTVIILVSHRGWGDRKARGRGLRPGAPTRSRAPHAAVKAPDQGFWCRGVEIACRAGEGSMCPSPFRCRTIGAWIS